MSKNKIVDLKSLGIIQDVKELKSKKEKASSNFDVGYAKEKLKWDKEKIRVRDSQNYSKEQKEAAYDTINRRENKLKEQAGIKKQENKIYEHSFVGKLSNKIGEGARKLATQRIISRKILKKNNMTVRIPEYKAPSVLGDPNRFFKDELSQERRNMFFQ